MSYLPDGWAERGAHIGLLAHGGAEEGGLGYDSVGRVGALLDAGGLPCASREEGGTGRPEEGGPVGGRIRPRKSPEDQIAPT